MTSTETGERSLSQELLYGARYYLSRRPALVGMGAAALGIAAWFNWGWLVAIGVAPVLLAVMPCAAMCALGLCSMRMRKSSVDSQSATSARNGDASSAIPLSLAAQSAQSEPVDEAGKKTKIPQQSHKGCC